MSRSLSLRGGLHREVLPLEFSPSRSSRSLCLLWDVTSYLKLLSQNTWPTTSHTRYIDVI
jgi:hypothetical protein